MTKKAVLLGNRVGPFDSAFDSDFVRRFADATNDPSPRTRAGTVIPPVALVTRIWEAQEASRDRIVPIEFQRSASGGVHGEHDLVVHRVIVPGKRLRTWAEGHGARPAGRNSLVTVRYLTFDVDDVLVAEQFWTTVWLGVTCEPAGSPVPDHGFPDEARERLLGVRSFEVDDDMARRYADVSGDWSPHHFDVEAARVSGFDRVFLHGLCTMALCTQALVDLVAGGDATRVRRVAVRFARPTFLGDQLDVRVYDAGPLRYAFEAASAGATVISNGRAELATVS